MQNNLEHLDANLFSVIAKERELLKNGYRKKDLADERFLDGGEYLVRAPFYKNFEALQGWETISIIWRTS